MKNKKGYRPACPCLSGRQAVGRQLAIGNVILLVLLLAGCGAPTTDLTGVQVLYSGPAYGDFIEIAASIKQCMHSDIETLPTLTIVSGNFRCNTPGGWVEDAWGCYAWGEVTVSLPRLELTHGQAWAHELTHFYGDLSEGNGCGNFWYSGFDWQRGK